MGKGKGEVSKPLVCIVADCKFFIRFFADFEMHLFICESDPKLNWNERVEHKGG
jgi:hypothetical protein